MELSPEEILFIRNAVASSGYELRPDEVQGEVDRIYGIIAKYMTERDPTGKVWTSDDAQKFARANRYRLSGGDKRLIEHAIKFFDMEAEEAAAVRSMPPEEAAKMLRESIESSFQGLTAEDVLGGGSDE